MPIALYTMRSMFNKFLTGLMVTQASAQEVCTSVYGGGVVCGAHAPVETGLADINPAFWGFMLLAVAGAVLYLARRVRKA